ncbi:MAG: helix-turn-helix domain-containing protein [Mycobacterium sp.]|nr:helix-turn-helix domain-containing protein [Mycobacterium sp.]
MLSVPVADDLAAGGDGHEDRGTEQFERLSRLVSERLVPMQLSTDDVSRFQAGMRSTSLGVVKLSDIWAHNDVIARRTRKLISSTDPDYLKVSVQMHGSAVVSQGDQQAALGPGDFVLYDTARPYQYSAGTSVHLRTVVFPRDALRLSPAQLQRLTTRPISGREGLGFVVSQYFAALGRQLDTGVSSASWYLSAATLDLLGASFAELLACRGPTELDSGRAGLLFRVRAFIERRLGDPDLDGATIAGAHHISVRYLQKLFEGQDQTVTGWIRTQRLEHCRRDLANPALADEPVTSIAAHWGLVDPPHFSRLFKSTYGLAPRDYRARALSELCTGRCERLTA